MEPEKIQQIRDGLGEIMEYFGGIPEEGKVKFWDDLAAKLSRIVGKNKPWTWRYPKQVYEGQTGPSELFASAVYAMGAAIDEVPTAVVYTVQVRVFAKPGTVEDGSVILGQSKPCKRPGCRVRIVPNVPWRDFCSKECGEIFRKESRKRK